MIIKIIKHNPSQSLSREHLANIIFLKEANNHNEYYHNNDTDDNNTVII